MREEVQVVTPAKEVRAEIASQLLRQCFVSQEQQNVCVATRTFFPSLHSKEMLMDAALAKEVPAELSRQLVQPSFHRWRSSMPAGHPRRVLTFLR